MKKAILIAMIGAMTLGVNAGDWGKAPVGKAPIEECIDLGGEISVGYATDYYLLGFQMAEDTVWADVNYTFDGLAVPVTIGATYMNSTVPLELDQLDLYVNIALGTFAGFDTTLGYTHHYFPEVSGLLPWSPDFGQASLGLRRSLGFADLLLGTNYLVGGPSLGGIDAVNGWYHTIGLEKSIALTDNISLVISGAAGYLDGRAGIIGGAAGHGWSDYQAKLSLPIQLNCRAVLTPYVGYYEADGAHNIQLLPGVTPGNNVHSGVTLSVTF